MPNIFISGANSGLGKAFCHAYATRDPSSIFYLLDRSFQSTSEQTTPLLDLPQDQQWIRDHIIPITCDVTDPEAVTQKLANLNVHFDIVIHSAGVRGLVPSAKITQYSDVAVADSLEVMDMQTLMRTFEINAAGTFLLLRALLPYLRRPSNDSEHEKGKHDDMSAHTRHAKVVVMGSRMGSIGHNTTLGGAYAYRASKAALNAIVKSFSVDVPDVVFTVMHPGRVETGLVEIKEEDAMNVDDVVNGILPMIDGLTQNDSGRFLDRFGVEIPW